MEEFFEIFENEFIKQLLTQKEQEIIFNNLQLMNVYRKFNKGNNYFYVIM